MFLYTLQASFNTSFSIFFLTNNEEIRDKVIGKIPKGNYQGLKFTLGIPSDLNHEDATIAPSPLNLTAMWWSWQGGYKAVRIELKSSTSVADTTLEQSAPSEKDFLIHLGSTGCQVDPNSQKPSSCLNENTPAVVLSNFNPETDVVVADLAALVANTNLETNQSGTAPGCMSEPEDSDCIGIFDSFGLPFSDQPSSGQTFFRVENTTGEGS